MNNKLLQDIILFVEHSGCNPCYPNCNGPTMRPKKETCPRCSLLARILHHQKIYKPRAKRNNMHLI